MVTIKDIAREAGVSFTTVSNVIHGRYQHVSRATIERVERAMKDLGYVPSMSARGLVSRTSRLIALAYGHRDLGGRTMLEDAFASTLVGAVEREVRARQYYLMLSAVQNTEDLLQMVSTWNVDGVLAFGLSPKEGKLLRESTDKPLVFVDGVFLPGEEELCANVGLADRAAGAEMTQYLIARGHRRIAFCCGDGAALVRPGATRERMLGWEAALHQWGIEPTDNWRIVWGPDADPERRKAADFALLERLGDFTALFFENDMLAAHVLNFLLDHGVRVPGNISLVGFDGNDYARLSRPAITTMRQDVRRKGEIAARLLLQYITDNAMPTEHNVRLSCQLQEGGTVATLKP